jgi:hypothetical protein
MLSLSCAFIEPARAQGFKGSVELLAEADVVLIDRGLGLGRWAKGTDDTGKQRLDDLVAQDEVGAHGPDAGRIGFVAVRVSEPLFSSEIWKRA